MPTITLKDIPEDLHARLKEAAAAEGRSLNKEILLRLKISTMQQRKTDVKAILAKAKRIRRSLEAQGVSIDDAFLARARNEGRP